MFYLSPPDTPAPTFGPTRAVSCDECGLSASSSELFANHKMHNQVKTHNQVVCYLCRLGCDPNTDSAAISLLLLPEFSQSELNVLFTALTLTVMQAQKDKRSDDIAVCRRRYLLESFFTRAQHTHDHLPITQDSQQLRGVLQAMPEADRKHAETELAALRYIPDTTFRANVLYFNRLLGDSESLSKLAGVGS